MRKPSKYRMQVLDIWAATHSEKVNKEVYAVIHTAKKVDIVRLKYAIAQTFEVIPEILSYYNPQQCVLRRVDFTIDDVVKIHESEPIDRDEYWTVDIFSGPLLKVHLFRAGEGSQLRFCMSHIICDARGLVQYLELVCKFYNNPALSVKKLSRNVRTDIYKVSKRLKGIRHHETPELEAYLPDIGNIKLPFGDNSGARYTQLCTHIEANDFAFAREKAKQKNATANDLFMTAFLLTLSSYAQQERYVIHCPLDLRGVLHKELKDRLTICNLTSKYICPADISPGDNFDKTLSGVTHKMNMQKERMPGYTIADVKFLFRWEWLFSQRFLARMVRERHKFYSVYYTNCGILNESAICMHDNDITMARVTGGFEKAPVYPLSLSTFKGSVTITCNINASPANLLLAEEILGGVRSRIMDWIGR